MHDLIYAIVFGAFKVLAVVTVWVFTVVEAVVGPLPGGLKISIVILGLSATLIGAFLLFRAARRPTCRWPRPVRAIVQAPGWMLVPLGVYCVIGLAVMEVQEHRVGLGTGTCVAVIGATLKGLWKAYGRGGDQATDQA